MDYVQVHFNQDDGIEFFGGTVNAKHLVCSGIRDDSFDWTYEDQETCLLLEGEVTVTPEGGTSVRFGAGDLVVFPAGMDCRWDVKKAVRKHYRFGD